MIKMFQAEPHFLKEDEYYNLIDATPYDEEALETIRLKKLMQDSIKNVQEQIQAKIEGKPDGKSPTYKNIHFPKNEKSILHPEISLQSFRSSTLLKLQSALNTAKGEKQIHCNKKQFKHLTYAIPLAPPEIENKSVIKVSSKGNEKQQSNIYIPSKSNENYSFRGPAKRKELSIQVLRSIDIQGSSKIFPQENNCLLEIKKVDNNDAHEFSSNASSMNHRKVLMSVATNTDNFTPNQSFSKVNVSTSCESFHSRNSETHKSYDPHEEMINKSTQANSLYFSKGVQANAESSSVKASDVTVDSRNTEENKSPSSYNLTPAAFHNVENINHGKEIEQQPKQEIHSSTISQELVSVIKEIFENYRKEIAQMNYLPQKQNISAVSTRDVSIQMNPPLSSSKDTMTDNVKMQHANSQCGDGFVTFCQSPERFTAAQNLTAEKRDRNVKRPTCEKNVMTTPTVATHAETQVETLVLNVSTQTSEVQQHNNGQYSATNTSVSSATMSDSEFVDDTLSEGEVRLPWNLRLISALDKNTAYGNSMLTSGRSDTTSWEQDDYSLSEGEIHPKCLAYYESLLQQKKSLTASAKEDKSVASEKLISTLENHLASLSKKVEMDTNDSTLHNVRLQCSKTVDTTNIFSDEEYSSRSLSPGEVFLKPKVSSSLIQSRNISVPSYTQDNVNNPGCSVRNKIRTSMEDKDVDSSQSSDFSFSQHRGSDLEKNIQSQDNDGRNIMRTFLQTVHEEELNSS